MKDVHRREGCDRTSPHQCLKKVGQHLEAGKGEGNMSSILVYYNEIGLRTENPLTIPRFGIHVLQ